MATIRTRANQVADATLNAAERAVESTRSAKERANRRYGEKIDNAESTLAETAENLGRHMRETYDASLEQLQEGTEYARRTVARNPLMAVAGAFIGGLIAASLFRRS